MKKIILILAVAAFASSLLFAPEAQAGTVRHQLHKHHSQQIHKHHRAHHHAKHLGKHHKA